MRAACDDNHPLRLCKPHLLSLPPCAPCRAARGGWARSAAQPTGVPTRSRCKGGACRPRSTTPGQPRRVNSTTAPTVTRYVTHVTLYRVSLFQTETGCPVSPEQRVVPLRTNSPYQAKGTRRGHCIGFLACSVPPRDRCPLLDQARRRCTLYVAQGFYADCGQDGTTLVGAHCKQVRQLACPHLMSQFTSRTNSTADNTPQCELSVRLEEAIEQFTHDLIGEHHPRMTATLRQLKAGFSPSQLASTNRQFVADAMERIMQYMVETFIQHGRVNAGQRTPLVRSIVLSGADRALVERYITRLQSAKPGPQGPAGGDGAVGKPRRDGNRGPSH